MSIKKRQSNIAFSIPYLSTETRQVGITKHKIAVWQNPTGDPFICVHDARGNAHFMDPEDGWEPLPHPHRTWSEDTNEEPDQNYTLHINKRALCAVIAALRYWQANTDHHDRWHDPAATDDDNHSPLTDEEIDQLCQQCNFS